VASRLSKSSWGNEWLSRRNPKVADLLKRARETESCCKPSRQARLKEEKGEKKSVVVWPPMPRGQNAEVAGFEEYSRHRLRGK